MEHPRTGQPWRNVGAKKGSYLFLVHMARVLGERREIVDGRSKGGSTRFRECHDDRIHGVPSNPLMRVVDDKVLVDVVAAGDSASLEADLRALGMEVTGRFGRIVSGLLPIAALDDVATLASVQFAQPAYSASSAGSVTSQGVRAMRADSLQSFVANGVAIDGQGVTVGLLSNSVDCLGGAGTLNELATNSGTIYGHANAFGAETVGAAAYFQTPAFGVAPPLLEPSSSAGTTPLLFTTTGMPTLNARADTPEVVGPDNVNTTFFGGSDIPDPGDGSDTDTFPNFRGTSAAAPHVAGVAALMRQVSASSSPATVYSALEATAIDIGAPGFDNDTGFGLVQAVAAVCSLTTCTARTAAPALSWLALAIVLTVLLLIGVWHPRDRPRRPE